MVALPDVGNLMLSSREPNTRKTYFYAFGVWSAWATAHGCRVLPALPLSVATFLLEKVEARVSCSTINGYIFSIGYCHRLSGNDNPCDDEVVMAVVDAAQRICPRNFNRKDPIAVDEMRRVYDYLAPGVAMVNKRLWAMAALMFGGFLRYDEVSGVRLRDITFHDDHVKIFLPRSKVDALREGDCVRVAETKVVACPVGALRAYLDRAEAKRGEEFVFRRVIHTKQGGKLSPVNKPVTYSSVRRELRRVLMAVGLDPRRFGLHSMRAGGASKAANAGVEDRLFQRHGRWKSSKSKNSYVRDNIDRMLSVSRDLVVE